MLNLYVMKVGTCPIIRLPADLIRFQPCTCINQTALPLPTSSMVELSTTIRTQWIGRKEKDD
jgi:hypothetical protein